MKAVFLLSMLAATLAAPGERWKIENRFELWRKASKQMDNRFLCSECVDEMRNLGFLVRAGASDIRVRFVPLLVLRLWINSRKSAQINLCNKFLSCSWFKRVESKMTAMKKTDFLFSSSWKEPCHAFVCFQPVVGQDGSLTRLNRGLWTGRTLMYC